MNMLCQLESHEPVLWIFLNFLLVSGSHGGHYNHVIVEGHSRSFSVIGIRLSEKSLNKIFKHFSRLNKNGWGPFSATSMPEKALLNELIWVRHDRLLGSQLSSA